MLLVILQNTAFFFHNPPRTSVAMMRPVVPDIPKRRTRPMCKMAGASFPCWTWKTKANYFGKPETQLFCEAATPLPLFSNVARLDVGIPSECVS